MTRRGRWTVGLGVAGTGQLVWAVLAGEPLLALAAMPLLYLAAGLGLRQRSTR